jgi:hypothetical protein
LVRALPAGSYLVLAHPASDIHPAEMAEMIVTARWNRRPDLAAGHGRR